MEKLTVYISGKISGLADLGVPAFEEAEQKLQNTPPILGLPKNTKIEVLNPHKLPSQHDKSWEAYMRECVKAIAVADIVAVLPNWSDSRGAIVEVLLSKLLHIPIVTTERYELLNPDYGWLLWTLLSHLKK